MRTLSNATTYSIVRFSELYSGTDSQSVEKIIDYRDHIETSIISALREAIQLDTHVGVH